VSFGAVKAMLTAVRFRRNAVAKFEVAVNTWRSLILVSDRTVFVSADCFTINVPPGRTKSACERPVLCNEFKYVKMT
jgi:hypothetical protein